MTTDRVQGRTQMGRKFDFTVAIGAQEDFSTELHLLGQVEYLGQTYAAHGSTTIREGRDALEATLRRCDTNEALMDSAVEDILYGIFKELDEQEDGIIAQEMKRMCG